MTRGTIAVAILLLCGACSAITDAVTGGQGGGKADDPSTSAATEALLRHVDKYDAAEPMDLAVVVDLVENQGADIDARDASDCTVVALVVLSYAGAPNSPARAAALEVLRYLVERGADTSSADNAGFTPLNYLARYAPGDITEPFELLMSTQPDLSIVDPTNGLGIVHRLAQKRDPKLLLRVVDAGADLTVKTRWGDSVMSLAAALKPGPDGIVPLETVAGLLSADVRAELADAPSGSGWTPLVWAADVGNVAAARYLLDNFDPDLDRLTGDDENALSIARSRGNQELIDLLFSRGATDPVLADHIGCRFADPNGAPTNASKLDFETLLSIIDTCSVRSIDDLLPLLPRSYRSGYTLAYASRGVQEASFEFPRVILYGLDATLIAAFNGHPDQAGYDSLELIQYRDATRTFELRSIRFGGKTGVQVSQANPPACLECHRDSPRPNWDNWSFWPGFYRAEQENFYPEEMKGYERYLDHRDSGRYQWLLQEGRDRIRTVFGLRSAGNNMNLRLDFLLDVLNGQKLAREIASDPVLAANRHAVLGALSCAGTIEQFDMGKQHKSPPTEELAEQLRQLNRDEFLDRVDRLRSLVDGTPAGKQQRFLLEYPGYAANGGGESYEIERVAQLRWVVEGLGRSMEGWSPLFDDNRNRYVFTALTSLEALVWRELLDPVADAALYQLYQTAYQGAVVGGAVLAFVNNTPAAGPICDLLKQGQAQAVAGQR